MIVLQSNLLYVTLMDKIIRKRATISLFSCFMTFRELNTCDVNESDLKMSRKWWGLMEEERSQTLKSDI